MQPNHLLIVERKGHKTFDKSKDIHDCRHNRPKGDTSRCGNGNDREYQYACQRDPDHGKVQRFQIGQFDSPFHQS